MIFGISIAIFIVTGVVWIKISDYFLSAVDIVHHSRFSYWFQKYISGFISGFILALIFFFVALSYQEPTEKSSIKDSKNIESSQKSPDSDRKANQSLQVIGLDCNENNNTIKAICSDRELILANNNYHNLYTKASQSVNKDELDNINNALVSELVKCNTNSQCIFFSFKESIIKLENLTK